MNSFGLKASFVFGFLFSLSSVALAETTPLSQARNAFASDLYGVLSREKGNRVVSPYSISEALSMTFLGAQGETEKEMEKALRLDSLGSKELPVQQALVQQRAQQKWNGQNLPGGAELRIANALWGEKTFHFNPVYVAAVKDGFAGNLESVDFNDELATRGKINDWVAEKTNFKIKELIGRGTLNESTRLVLTNAIYFKADWLSPFKKSSTRTADFTLETGHKIPANFMQQTHTFDLASLDGFRLLVLPYKGLSVSMLVLLPNSSGGLPDVERRLTPERLTQWLEKCRPTEVDVSLPRFKASSTMGLQSPLEELGMKTAFVGGRADFSSMLAVPDKSLYISSVLHKAYVAVDEDGTEAAAATAVTMQLTSMPVPSSSEIFKADHPFLYVIRANETGDILFIGRLADPSLPAE